MSRKTALAIVGAIVGKGCNSCAIVGAGRTIALGDVRWERKPHPTCAIVDHPTPDMCDGTGSPPRRPRGGPRGGPRAEPQGEPRGEPRGGPRGGLRGEPRVINDK